MHPIDIKNTLNSMVILVDTREQDTPALHRRMEDTQCHIERAALLSGDYSCVCVLPDGVRYSLAERVVIERKMTIDEICGNFTRGRERFQREFDRLKLRGGKPYLLIEGASWEAILAGKYRSQFSPQCLIASLFAWQARYDAHLLFCKPESSGTLIKKVLYYELKEILESGELDEHCR